jgi:hypothetical protein
LLDEHAKNDPESIDVLRYRIRLKIRQNKPSEAIALFQAAVAKPLPDEQREEILSDFLTELAEAGKLVEGYRAAPDANAAFRILAEDLQERGRPEDLRRLVQAHGERSPDDPWLALFQGEVFVEENAWDKAAQAFQRGLAAAPEDLHGRLRERFLFVACKAGRQLQAYEETKPRNETFSKLADYLAWDKKGVELEALVKAHQPRAAEDPEMIFYEALAKVLQKRLTEATSLLDKAYQKQTDQGQRENYVSRFLLAMDEASPAIERYRAVPDKVHAFAILAPQLVYQKKDKELAALLEEHGQGRGPDPIREFFEGELNLLRGEPAKAGPHFAAALAKGAKKDEWRFRNGLLRAKVKAGQAANAYQEAELGPRAFEDLANLCIQEKDAKQLQALIDVHRKARPDDPKVAVQELNVKWLNKDYEGALRLLNEHREDVFSWQRFRWTYNDHLIRCLVRLKRTPEAVREAEAIAKKRFGDQTLLVLAHAASGDVKQTLATLEKIRPESFFLSGCYQDEDLGPILRSEPFREVREKFPEPKDKREGDGRDVDDP